MEDLEKERPEESTRGEEDSADGEMTFLDHLEELRWRILWGLGAILVGTVVGFVLTQNFGVIDFLISPVSEYVEDEKLTYLSPTEPFFVTFKIAFFLGIILSLPILFYHFWAFVAPALLRSEKKIFFPAIFASVILFSIGIIMAFGVVLPLGLRFLLSFQTSSLKPMITIGEYLSFATRISLAFGFVFELPLIVAVLSYLGILTPDFMRQKRRHAYVVIFILSAILTPADVASMIMMAVPLVLLFEGSIYLSVVITARRNRSEAPYPGG
jgi:sec-independent protein translocase protein TatC